VELTRQGGPDASADAIITARRISDVTESSRSMTQAKSPLQSIAKRAASACSLAK
jgi:hypothetical protein